MTPPLPLFDPQLALELAKTLFAGVSAVAASISVWRKSRDKKQAAKAFDETLAAKRQSDDATGAARQLVSIIPPDVIADLEKRADACWTGYRQVLGGNYLPNEVDKATDAVQLCVCRELGRINTLNGSIPERWMGQWERFKCA